MELTLEYITVHCEYWTPVSNQMKLKKKKNGVIVHSYWIPLRIFWIFEWIDVDCMKSVCNRIAVVNTIAISRDTKNRMYSISAARLRYNLILDYSSQYDDHETVWKISKCWTRKFIEFGLSLQLLIVHEHNRILFSDRQKKGNSMTQAMGNLTEPWQIYTFSIRVTKLNSHCDLICV